MPQHPGKPNDQAMLAGMDAMLGGGLPGGGGPPGGGLPGGMPQDPLTSGEPDPRDIAIAELASENAELRSLIGLGPDDPIPGPAPADPGGAGAPPPPGVAPPF